MRRPIKNSNQKKRLKLREGLGDYPPRGNAKPPKYGLTLHDLGELISRAGRDAGFIVDSEHKVLVEGEARSRKIDWVWLDPKNQDGKPVVAFEIEGQGVNPKSLKADINKFRTRRARLNVIALFQVDHDRKPNNKPPHGLSPYKWVMKHIDKDFPVEILLDEELMRPKGIKKLQSEAKSILNRKTNK